MPITWKKFNVDAYTKRRIKELRGEKIYDDESDDEVARYIKRRIAELQKSGHDQQALDNSSLGWYTLSTMGDGDGET